MNKIDFNTASQTEAARLRRGDDARPAAQPERPKGRVPDTVTLSERAAEADRLKELAAGLPDVRAEKVAHLRGLVRAGEYDPPAAAIADAILRDEG